MKSLVPAFYMAMNQMKATCWVDTFNGELVGTWSYFDSIEDAYKTAIDYSSLNHNYQPLPTLKEVTGWLRAGAKMANICHYNTYRIWIYLGHSEPPYKHNSVYSAHMGLKSEAAAVQKREAEAVPDK